MHAPMALARDHEPRIRSFILLKRTEAQVSGRQIRARPDGGTAASPALLGPLVHIERLGSIIEDVRVHSDLRGRIDGGEAAG